MSKTKRNTRERYTSIDNEELPVETLNPRKAGDLSGDTGQSTNPKKSSRISRYLRTHLWMVAVFAFLSLSALGATLKYLEDDARRQMANGSLKSPNVENASLLNRVNPFITLPSPTPTPQLSKEYIYAGSRLLAVEDANATAVPPADLAIWRPDSNNGTGTWWVMDSNGTNHIALQWGANDDEPVPGDYDGDGKTDFAVFRPSNGGWYIFRSNDGTLLAWAFGQSGDKTEAADFDGDGKTDAGIYRAGWWYILRSSDGGVTYQAFGNSTDTPAAADYDGDGKADIAVWRGSDTTFYYMQSSDNTPISLSLGQNGSKVVSADYDGDGKADFGVFDPATANWYIRHSTGTQTQTYSWGNTSGGDTEVPNDYDGDGRVDLAVWRPSNGYWYIKNSADNSTRSVLWGQNGDTPVPAFYRR